MTERLCLDCSHWRATKVLTDENRAVLGQRLGECRRRPPVLSAEPVRSSSDTGTPMASDPSIAIFSARDLTAFPVTIESDWCGKFRERPELARARQALAASEREERALEERFVAAHLPNDVGQDRPF